MPTASLTHEDGVSTLVFTRPERDNALDEEMLAMAERALDEAGQRTGLLVIAGLPEVFCTGADLADMSGGAAGGHDPDRLFRLWQRMVEGDVITVAHVRGRAAAGGIGFAAAADFVVADTSTTFALPEMLFGLVPAMVIPFLARRIGSHRAHAMALSTRTIDVVTAANWGLVDDYGERSGATLGRLMYRLRRIPRDAVAPYKAYVGELLQPVGATREAAVATNLRRFSDPLVRERIRDFSVNGVMPWENGRGVVQQ